MKVFLILLDLLISVYIFVFNLTEGKNYAGFPKSLYKKTKLNAFGVGLVFSFLFCVAPFYYLIWFGYWLIHVGRREKKQ